MEQQKPEMLSTRNAKDWAKQLMEKLIEKRTRLDKRKS